MKIEFVNCPKINTIKKFISGKWYIHPESTDHAIFCESENRFIYFSFNRPISTLSSIAETCAEIQPPKITIEF